MPRGRWGRGDFHAENGPVPPQVSQEKPNKCWKQDAHVFYDFLPFVSLVAHSENRKLSYIAPIRFGYYFPTRTV